MENIPAIIDLMDASSQITYKRRILEISIIRQYSTAREIFQIYRAKTQANLSN
jgi:hypothetical protein